MVVTAAVFSYSQGVIHTYYAVALAPAIAALAAIGAHQLWRRRETLGARVAAAGVVAVTGGWSYVLLERTPSWQPWLRVAVLAASAVAVASLFASARPGRLARRSGLVAIVAAVIAALGGPAGYAVATVTSTHSGSIPSAGPSAASAGGGPGGFAAPAGGGRGPGAFAAGGAPSGAPGAGSASGLFGGAPPSGAGGFGGPPGVLRSGGRVGGGAGGVSVSTALAKALQSGAGAYRWVAATTGSASAASLELASRGEPVMALGGFNGNGGELSLASFISYVRAGEIHYFVAAGGGGAGPGGGTANTTAAISSWVQSHFSAQTIGGVTVYDLSR
jgi:hypothetical protein